MDQKKKSGYFIYSIFVLDPFGVYLLTYSSSTTTTPLDEAVITLNKLPAKAIRDVDHVEFIKRQMCNTTVR